MKRIAAAALITLGLAAAAAPAAQAGPPTAGTTLSNGTPTPVVKWDHKKWKQCWKLSYIQAREDGFSPNGATAYADLVCGDPPL